MGWIAFWLIAVGYFVLAASRFPKYYKMFYEKDRKDFHMIRTTEESQKEAFWYSVWLMLVWPFYEIGKQIQNKAIQYLNRGND